MSRWLFAALPALVACPDPDPGAAAETAPPSVSRDETAPDWRSAFSTKFAFDAGERAVVVDMSVAPGFHAYTVGETTGKPLLLTLDPDGPFTLRGDVRYPKGAARQLPIGPSVIVEGEARIVAPVERKDGGEGGRVKGNLRYQICTEDACDRPRKLPFEVTAQAAPGP